MDVIGVLSLGARDLFPGYFAVAMATGIVSISAALLGWRSVAMALFYVNLIVYGFLWLLTLWRLYAYLPRLIGDLTGHARGPGLLTVVAATCILGSQFVILRNSLSAGFFCWLLALALWLLLIYTFFTAVTVYKHKPDLEKGLHGGWLIVVVATQALAVLGALLSPYPGLPASSILFPALALYLLGCALYLLIISLIFHRLTFIQLTPEEFAPDWWVNMGANAVTTLAGAALILRAADWQVLANILPFLEGFTLFFWVVATWWIPLLTILEFWRHALRHYPIRYNPRYWDIVFPLGMYTACTIELGRALPLPFVDAIPSCFIYVALVSWVLVFLWMVHHLARRLGAPARQGQTS